MDYTQLAEKLVKYLGLKYEPVAVKVIEERRADARRYSEPDKNLLALPVHYESQKRRVFYNSC